MTAPTIGLALIARDEEDTLPGLLASVEGAFDQVVLADTGSTDGTVDAFEAWAAAEKLRNPDFTGTVGRFDWRDDFAAARNFADSLLTTDWLAWADCDDVVVGADRLRGIVAGAPKQAKVIYFDYTNAPGAPADGRVQRERLVRRDVDGGWIGRVHEVKTGAITEADIAQVHPDVAHWTTRRSGVRDSSLGRNRAILHRWVSDEPGDSVPLRLLAAQEVLFGDTAEGLAHVERYVRLFREPVMTPHEAEMAWWAYQGLKEAIEGGPAYFVPPDDRGPLQALLVMVLDCLPNDFATGYSPAGLAERVEAEPPARPPAERKTRQQRRAEARARAKELAAA